MLYEYYNIIDIAERSDEEIEKRKENSGVDRSKKGKPKYTNSTPSSIVT